jgi:pimeloyl-ACP methyl ester carboxylesterase
MMWRGLLQEPAIPLRAATWICVDLPGYGGSDSFYKYDTEVLEALTEFIIAMRETFLTTKANGEALRSTYVVAHDWGAILAFRLAAEAAALADRFIITNGPHVSLLEAF